MKKIVLIMLNLLVLVSSVFAQVKMQGTITTKENTKIVPIPFANIALYNSVDTTQIIAGSVTDFKGKYVFESLKMGNYMLEISCIGYKSVKKKIRVSFPSVGNVLMKNFQMEEDTQMLSEVVVKGNRSKQYVDKTVRTFTEKEIKTARYSKDLIVTLPQLTTDALTGKLKDLRGGAMQVLINGIRATDNELKLLPPNKVLRVEYYDIPPARYAKSGAVVNIITKTLDDGYGGGFDVMHAFTTGFANDNAYFKYHKGHNQITMEYNINYRDYDDRESNQVYRYKLGNQDRKSEYATQDAFGYTTHTIGLKFTNQEQDKYVFQIGLRPNFRTSFSKGTKSILNNFGVDKQGYTGDFSNDTKIMSPVLDVYYWKKLTPTSDISFNLVGTMFQTKVDNENREYVIPSHKQSLTDIMHLDNRKKSLIGEVAYSKKTKLGNLNAGYKIETSWLKSDISNILGNYDYSSRYNEQYLYTEFSGNKGSLLYRLSLGGTLISNQSYSNKYNSFVFTPQLTLGYSLSNKHTFRLIAQRETDLPSVSDLSNNAQLLTPDIVSKGNPMLEKEIVSSAALVHSFNSKYCNISTAVLYSYTQNPINQYFNYKPNDTYITLTKENAKNAQVYGAYISGGLKPFGTNIFSLKGNFQVLKQNIDSELVGKISHWYTPLYLEGVFKWKDLTVSYSHTFISRKLVGAYLKNDENHSLFMARYRYKNFSFSSGVYWLGQPSKYHSETLDKSLVAYTSDTKIWNNKTMFVFGLSWNFHKGKSYNVRRNLQNKDTDAGTF
ncbi:MAG: TonB-dependent receptor [Tenacibaculum sp.]|nr:TonB-dependent receptor [Tenacibaculum sp.]